MRQAMDLARMAGIAPLVMMFAPALMEVLIERDELEAAEELRAMGMDRPDAGNPLFHASPVEGAPAASSGGDVEAALEDYDGL